MAADRHNLTNHRPLGLLEGVGIQLLHKSKMSFRLQILLINRKILDTAQFLQILHFVLHASILLARSPTANWILECKPRP